MEVKLNVRRIAFEIINKVEFGKSYSDDLINKYVDKFEDKRDFNLLRKIVLGVLERKYTLEYIISMYSKTKLKKIDPKILIIMKIAVYQMIFLTSIPDHASINEAVNHSKKLTKWNLSGYVNGVLRNISRNKAEISKLIDSTKDLEIKYNINAGIVEYIKENYNDDFDSLLDSLYNELPFSIRINENMMNSNEVFEELQSLGMNPKNSDITNINMLIQNPESVHNTKLYREGIISIQGEGSTLAVQVLDPRPGSKVLDLCAAPGTKSLLIAEYLKDSGIIIANDIDISKHKKIVQNFNRIKFSNYELCGFDASIYQPEMKEEFDYVLVDAPCSALGLIARKPEIRYRRSMETIRELRDLQRAILINAVKYLKPNGVLVYSTCTYGYLENEQQADFIENELNMEKSYFDYKGNSLNRIQLFNSKDNTDGFFIARFIKP
ncbi:16S rRNA (cytosine(967)-C(5))-methyltransferase RsmB [Microaceticoccus formicicus]|uniref:16S rRNA (cytosine(967)-C(5))-methyltransferase RsmB n=1 Tax=Microaceticoccus formicicus TaxID=3118105 RepID=UPI003CD045CC|nr:16S rRNA (cytosine(967)-C(5))-methyltransferase RsmB [Peptoniphilaceae bacterium AMB_02]